MPISFSNYTVRCNPYDTLTLSYNENGEVIYTCQSNLIIFFFSQLLLLCFSLKIQWSIQMLILRHSSIWGVLQWIKTWYFCLYMGQYLLNLISHRMSKKLSSLFFLYILLRLLGRIFTAQLYWSSMQSW